MAVLILGVGHLVLYTSKLYSTLQMAEGFNWIPEGAMTSINDDKDR